jgi:hypothetical protein
MQKKIDETSTSGEKLLRLFRKLLAAKGKHYQNDLATYLKCSPQTVIRLVDQIANEVGDNLTRGLDNRRRWYELKPAGGNILGLQSDELRCLGICRDLAVPFLSDEDRSKVDSTLLRFSMLLSEDAGTASVFGKDDEQEGYAFYNNGRIDYSPFEGFMKTLKTSALAHKICILRYRKAGTRDVEVLRFAPDRFVCLENTIYVLGALVNEDGTLDKAAGLAVHHLTNVLATDEEAGFEMPKADFESLSLPWHKPSSFTVTFTPGKASDYVRDRIWARNQTMRENSDGSITLTVTTSSRPEFLAWVRSFGDEAGNVQENGKPVNLAMKRDFDD